MSLTPEQFVEKFNNTELYPTVRDLSFGLGLAVSTIKNRASELRKKGYDLISRSGAGQTLYEQQNAYQPEFSREDCIDELLRVQALDPEKWITANWFRNSSNLSEATWGQYFGTWLEFRRQAGLQTNRGQHQFQRQLAKHASVDIYRDMNSQKLGLDTVYDKKNYGKYRTFISISDLHDRQCDPFALQVFFAALRMVKPDVVVLNGDLFDMYEFSRWTTDPREMDVVGNITFVHKILNQVREILPDTQIDFIGGNHELRLLKLLADATPAVRTLLSDLHGMDMGKMLGLDEYSINYVDHTDLAAFTHRDVKKEIEKNYKVYNDSLLFSHYPTAIKYGLPGTNGHHHRFKVWDKVNARIGPYNWVQSGAMQMGRSSYMMGDTSTTGFCIWILNTETGQPDFQYVDVKDYAVLAGRLFERSGSLDKPFFAPENKKILANPALLDIE